MAEAARRGTLEAPSLVITQECKAVAKINVLDPRRIEQALDALVDRREPEFAA
ncbi:hypothetical protein RA307_16120 [Xanthobacteraceae bacterium Astr-EGSB]|uniref:hypothetical protein n=1 Tax=Astrobacterium formosum TaxID=3069710 RepID=UPI0027B4E75B|nr:hypothetical protein [Xanthobacteraceae bacterium Astr-EGSB]